MRAARTELLKVTAISGRAEKAASTQAKKHRKGDIPSATASESWLVPDLQQ